MKKIFMFDVESTSLHGVGFAVGAVVFDEKSRIIETLELVSEEGQNQANPWVQENVIHLLKDFPTVKTLVELRTQFYDFMQKHKHHAEFWSDVNFPVETNFLASIVKDNEGARQWNMPYPLRDASNFLHPDIDRSQLAYKISGINFEKHNPTHDSIASYHCLKNIYPSLHRNHHYLPTA